MNLSHLPLGELCDIQIGKTPSRNRPEYWRGGRNYWASIADIDKSIIRHTKEAITDHAIRETGCNRVQVGTLLLSFKLSLGKVAFAGIPLCTNEAIAALPFRKPNILDPIWFYYRLLSIDWARFGRRAVKGNCLNKEILEEIEIEYPGLTEQKWIAGILTEADRLRQNRLFALDLLDSMLQATFETLFSRYIKRVESTPLENFLAMPLSNGLFEKNEKYGSDGTPVVWVDNLYHTISIDTSFLRRVIVTPSMMAKYRVMECDLLFTRSSLVREGIGQINIVTNLKEETLYECHIIRARPDTEKINPYYLTGLYRSLYGKHEILKRANTATMTTINQDALASLPCPNPPRHLQEQYEQCVKQVIRLRAAQEESLRQSDHLFQTLLHQSFTVQ